MKEVAFIRLRLLGDIVFTIPAVALFKRNFPAVRLHYVVEERYAEMAALIPGVDRVWAVPRRRGIREILAFARESRALGVGTVVDFHSGPASAVLTRASGAGLRVGYRTPNRNWAYNRRIARHDPARPAHSVHNQARLLEGLGMNPQEPPPYPVLGPEAFPVPPRFQALLSAGRGAVIHIGAGNRFRDWGEDRFRELLLRLGAAGVPCFLIGGSPEERARAARLSAVPFASDLSGPLSVRELLSLVSRSAVYVGADSGPLHVASLTATPLVALYGPNVASVSGPWRRTDVALVELEMGCRPCSQRRCKYGTIPCMGNISVEAVHEAVSQFIR